MLLKLRNKANSTDTLFLIDFGWVRDWIMFINEPLALSPKPIDNEFLH